MIGEIFFEKIRTRIKSEFVVLAIHLFIYLEISLGRVPKRERPDSICLFSNNKDDNKNVRFFLFSIFLRSNQPFRANPGRVFFRKQGLFSLNLVTFIVVLL